MAVGGILPLLSILNSFMNFMKLDNTQRAGGLVIEDAVRYRLRLPGAGPSRLLAPATACAYLGI